MTDVVGALREVTKAYPGTLAAQNITIEFRRGEIHGLVGENGAGKSTLVKILAGLIRPDHGYVEMGNRICRFASPRAASLAGIGVVHQSGSLIETLTVQENLELSKAYHGKPDESPLFLAGIPLRDRVATLSMRQRQRVEIYRLMLQRAQLLVLDEPTAALTRQEAALLFRDLRVLAKAGSSVLVISHKLPELISHCHTFTVLRKGRIVGQVSRENASVSELVQLCSGPHTHDDLDPVTNSEPAKMLDSPPLVHLKAITTADQEIEPLASVDLSLRRGEIIGLAGRTRSGAPTLLRLLRNEPVAIAGGTVEWDQSVVDGLADQAIGYVPADRVTRGVILDLSVGENLKLRRRDLLSRIGTAHREERLSFVESLIQRFDIRPARRRETLRNLSGGNIQKVLLAREMDYSQMLLIVESPTAGLDMGSATYVRRLLRQKADNGACVVVYSDDLDELAEVSDRVIVLVEGKIAAELIGDEISSDSIGLALSEDTLDEPEYEPFPSSTFEKAVCVD